MTDYGQLISSALYSYLPSGEHLEQVLIDSMNYSLSSGGKRIRPMLTLMFCELCGGDVKSAVPFACAVEMIHTYSLVHDDLPCMDNDDFRRGKPSNHKVYGEDIALLCGDALQSLAFQTMLSDSAVSKVGAQNAAKAAHALANYSGTLGMVGGQVIDLISEKKHAGIEVLRKMDEKKTAALIKAACQIGCIVADADDDLINAAGTFAENIGVAFQIMDDILDVTSTDSVLGKPVGSDSENDKSTYVSLLGIDECKSLVNRLTNAAISALEAFSGDTSKLKKLAFELSSREK